MGKDDEEKKKEELDLSDLEDEEGEAKPEARGLWQFFKVGEKLRQFLTYVLIALVVMGITVTVTVFVVRSMTGGGVRTHEPGVIEVGRPLTEFKLGENIQVKTADTDADHFVQMDIVLGYPEDQKELMTELNQRKSQMMDLAIDFFSGKKMNQLNDPEQRARMKEELLVQINQNLRSREKVKRIWFTKFSAM